MTVSSCIGAALGLLDEWLSGHHPQAPAGHWTGERAATDILVLARKRRAFRSLDTLLIKQAATTCSTAALSHSPRPSGLITRHRHPSA